MIETLTVDFPVSRHGIFRFFDTRDNPGSDSRVIPKDITVSRDGQPEPFERARARSAAGSSPSRSAAPTRTHDGPHVYRISYRIDGVLAKGTDGPATQFYWDLVPARLADADHPGTR